MLSVSLLILSFLLQVKKDLTKSFFRIESLSRFWFDIKAGVIKNSRVQDWQKPFVLVHTYA